MVDTVRYKNSFDFPGIGSAWTLEEFCNLCEWYKDPALYYFSAGDFERWVQGTCARPDLSHKVQAIRERGGDGAAALEAVLRAIRGLAITISGRAVDIDGRG